MFSVDTNTDTMVSTDAIAAMKKMAADSKKRPMLVKVCVNLTK